MKLIFWLIFIYVFFVLCSIVYLITGIGKWFYHDKLQWHRPDGTESFDGCSCCSHCKYCGKEIMQDSQGNWF